MRVAFLRLTPWLGGAPLRVVWADLVRGIVVERTSSNPTERPTTTDWFDERSRSCATAPTIRSRGNGATAAAAHVVPACPEHRKGAHYGRKGDLLPGILHVTPTGLDSWHRCRASGATTSSSASPRATPIPAASTASSCTIALH